ncbi:MAG TPA: HEAT repeat domain-containing protein, partial [Elusimicrobiales bacterium]|nr:HEAT repeat domain-containing protein [Elusimicrobiales bacterium]
KRAFAKASDQERMSVAGRLARAGKQGTRALLDLAENTQDRKARARAFTALEESVKDPNNQDEEILGKLEKMAVQTDRQTDRQTALHASMALMSFKKNLRAKVALKKAIQTQQGELDRAQLLGTFLVNIDKDKTEIPFFKEYFLNDKSEYVRIAAAGHLGSLGDKSGLAFCKTILEKEPIDINVQRLQMYAARAAGSIGDTNLLPILKTVAASRKYGVAQSRAIMAINDIELQSKQSKSQKLEYLKKSLGDPYSVRWAALTLANMKDKDATAVLYWAAQQKDLAGAKIGTAPNYFVWAAWVN